jgi:hypothetical protein
MKTLAYIILIVLVSQILIACSAQIGTGDTVYTISSTKYDSDLDINSPEGLAQYSTESYMKMMSGEMDASEGFDTLMSHSATAYKDYNESQKDAFINYIRSTKRYFKEKDCRIDRYFFSETIYDDEHASIYRIQLMSNGDMYYFRQDFVNENGTWKIRGDNPVDPFIIKK